MTDMAVQRLTARLRGLIKRRGGDATHTRYKVNAYKEATTEVDFTMTIQGLKHTSSVSATLGEGEDAIVRKKHTPNFLIVMETGYHMPLIKDILTIGLKQYRVTGVEDMGLCGFAYDVSLEVIDDGRQPL